MECLEHKNRRGHERDHEFSPFPRMSLRYSGFFYAGLRPIIIVILAWTDSVTMHTNWYHRLEGGGTRGFIVANAMFRIEVISRVPGNKIVAPPVPIYGGIIRFGASPDDGEGNPMPLFPPLNWRYEEFRPRGWHVEVFVIPLWFVVACYIPLWLATSYFLVLRKWKKIYSDLPARDGPHQ